MGVAERRPNDLQALVEERPRFRVAPQGIGRLLEMLQQGIARGRDVGLSLPLETLSSRCAFAALSTEQAITNELRGVSYFRLRTLLWLLCPEHRFDPGFQQLAARLMEIAELMNVLWQRPEKVLLDVVNPALG